ncbi:MAG TPA: cytoplasmic protein [Thermoanaerobaculia bacterium]|nr:cytoplasmic protein [Thermoanaerobaculia bacterium]
MPYGDDEQLWAFRQEIEDNVPLPADAHAVGEPVSVLEIDYDGNTRRGLVARCRRQDGTEHEVSAADLAFPGGSTGARYIACYRLWLGLEPRTAPKSAAGRSSRRAKATHEDLPSGANVALVTLAIRQSAARCRILGTMRELTLRTSRAHQLVPGEIATVSVHKQWQFARHPYLTGEIEGSRLDVAALGLQPLRLESLDTWDPEALGWSEDVDEYGEEIGPAILARGPRPAYEMEQVVPILPGSEWLEGDPILESTALRMNGDPVGAERLLMDFLTADLRCLDAHAHLGNAVFTRLPAEAIRSYEVGVRIGELSLATDFDGLLPWGFIDNRPFLRCLHGYGLCLWRLARADEAAATFERMLWLNPNDNQGARFLLPAVRAGKSWEDVDFDR